MLPMNIFYRLQDTSFIKGLHKDTPFMQILHKRIRRSQLFKRFVVIVEFVKVNQDKQNDHKVSMTRSTNSKMSNMINGQVDNAQKESVES